MSHNDVNSMIPSEFIDSNMKFIRDRIEIYSTYFEPEIIRVMKKDKPFVNWVLIDIAHKIEIARESKKYLNNYYQHKRKQARFNDFIHQGYDIESQIDYLTEDIKDKMDDIDNSLVALFEYKKMFSEL